MATGSDQPGPARGARPRQAQERHRAGEPVFLFLATYHTDADAQLDYAGGVIGHFWNGMSRKDVMKLGDMLDDGTVALLIVGKSKLNKALEKAEKEAS